MEDDLSVLLIAGGAYLAILGFLGFVKLALEVLGVDAYRTYSFRTWAIVALVIVSIFAIAWRQG